MLAGGPHALREFAWASVHVRACAVVGLRTPPCSAGLTPLLPAPLLAQFTGASLVLQPLQALLVWAYVAHPSELRYLAERDQSYLLSSILDWVDAHRSLAGGLAAVWLTLQTAAVLLGLAHGCCAGGPPPPKHPW